jgi:hypothetical protein
MPWQRSAAAREPCLRPAAQLPANPLDQLTELLGGEGNVAEMTGRKSMLTRQADGTVVCKARALHLYMLHLITRVLSPCGDSALA